MDVAYAQGRSTLTKAANTGALNAFDLIEQAKV